MRFKLLGYDAPGPLLGKYVLQVKVAEPNLEWVGEEDEAVSFLVATEELKAKDVVEIIIDGDNGSVTLLRR